MGVNRKDIKENKGRKVGRRKKGEKMGREEEEKRK